MTRPDREAIRAKAKSLGFDAVRMTEARLAEDVRGNFQSFLAQGLEGDMGWLRDKAERRADPRTLWPEARSVIMLGLNYGRNIPLRSGSEGVVSVYAQGRDYHDVLKSRLKQLARWLNEASGHDVKVFVDTAPVMEKPLAQQSGLGWQGKHTNLVSREFGSWLFLGEVFTTLPIEPDAPEVDHCGACRRCLDACPTGAFIAPYKLDPRRCVSYLTIEHKGPIPRDLRAGIGNRIYGCDDCLAVCPWNKFAQAAREAAFTPKAAMNALGLRDLAGLDDAAFRVRFAGSPVKRTGRARFLRNVLIAIGNSGDSSLVPDIEARLADESPLVRGAAVWALSRLAPTRAAAQKTQHLGAETDAEVREEWALI
ncbi:MAG: tRNA epoxyqueuosine(34) reductase QueG [Rhodospirillaceae bacterium]|nr:tRNA epoxyqueuosine(34) reductase QueG [Rhodospirillaceae bacterium]